MPAYIVKKWDVRNTANQNGNFVEIEGRTPGVISWFMGLMGVEPGVAIRISDKVYSYEAGSWGGRYFKTIPIAKISSVYYGYAKPWKQALIFLIALAFFLTGTLRIVDPSLELSGVILVSMSVAVVVSLLYYSLNKKITLGVHESGGKAVGIIIKSSVVNGSVLDEVDVEQVGDFVKQLLILNNSRRP